MTGYRFGIAAGQGFIARKAPKLNPIEKLPKMKTTKSQIDIRKQK